MQEDFYIVPPFTECEPVMEMQLGGPSGVCAAPRLITLPSFFIYQIEKTLETVRYRPFLRLRHCDVILCLKNLKRVYMTFVLPGYGLMFPWNIWRRFPEEIKKTIKAWLWSCHL